MLITHETAIEQYGSPYRIDREVTAGNLFKVARGIYSDVRNADPYAIAALRYPKAIVTMDSAFYLHGLTDFVPMQVHLATLRNATRIKDPSIVQSFSSEKTFGMGKVTIERSGTSISIYSRERMLVELMRASSSMPLDYYKEIVASYRRIVEELDLRAVEDYMAAFERNGYMFEILRKEVL